MADDGLAAMGLAEGSLVEARDTADRLAVLAQALSEGAAERVEQLPGPFLWYF